MVESPGPVRTYTAGLTFIIRINSAYHICIIPSIAAIITHI